MAKVRRDEHGLYLQAGGYIVRPLPREGSHLRPIYTDGTSRYQEGEKVYARHIGGSEKVRVGTGDQQEIWFTQGEEE